MSKRATAVAVTLAMLLMSLTVAPVASAQIVAEDLAKGAPPPPQYALAADGTLTIDGDVVVDCPSFSRFTEQYGDAPPSDPYLQSELEEAQSALEDCQRAGFSPSGGTAYGYQYPPENSMAADAEGAEGATEAAGGDPADAATLKSAIETARADRTGGIAPAAASEAGASRAAKPAMAEKEDAPSPEGDVEEEQAKPPGVNASGGIDELPATGGVSLVLGAGALFLVAGGLLVRRVVG